MAEATKPASRALKALVVDGDPAARARLRHLLARAGIATVHEARDGAEAIEVLRGFVPDVVICDIFVARVNGIKFTRRVRRMGGTHPHIPILLTAGRVSREVVETARDAGADGFLAKPIDETVFGNRIGAVLKGSRKFVESGVYRGPDRRRRDKPHGGHERRQSAAPEAGPDEGLGSVPGTEDESAAGRHRSPRSNGERIGPRAESAIQPGDDDLGPIVGEESVQGFSWRDA